MDQHRRQRKQEAADANRLFWKNKGRRSRPPNGPTRLARLQPGHRAPHAYRLGGRRNVGGGQERSGRGLLRCWMDCNAMWDFLTITGEASGAQGDSHTRVDHGHPRSHEGGSGSTTGLQHPRTSVLQSGPEDAPVEEAVGIGEPRPSARQTLAVAHAEDQGHTHLGRSQHRQVRSVRHWPGHYQTHTAVHRENGLIGLERQEMQPREEDVEA